MTSISSGRGAFSTRDPVRRRAPWTGPRRPSRCRAGAPPAPGRDGYARRSASYAFSAFTSAVFWVRIVRISSLVGSRRRLPVLRRRTAGREPRPARRDAGPGGSGAGTRAHCLAGSGALAGRACAGFFLGAAFGFGCAAPWQRGLAGSPDGLDLVAADEGVGRHDRHRPRPWPGRRAGGPMDPGGWRGRSAAAASACSSVDRQGSMSAEGLRSGCRIHVRGSSGSSRRPVAAFIAISHGARPRSAAARRSRSADDQLACRRREPRVCPRPPSRNACVSSRILTARPVRARSIGVADHSSNSGSGSSKSSWITILPRSIPIGRSRPCLRLDRDEHRDRHASPGDRDPLAVLARARRRREKCVFASWMLTTVSPCRRWWTNRWTKSSRLRRRQPCDPLPAGDPAARRRPPIASSSGERRLAATGTARGADRRQRLDPLRRHAAADRDARDARPPAPAAPRPAPSCRRRSGRRSGPRR